MPCLKLYYFNARARGEVCRLSIALAKIDFEDIRFEFDGEEWTKEKACTVDRCCSFRAAYMTGILTLRFFG